jgi:hypothetical protein
MKAASTTRLYLNREVVGLELPEMRADREKGIARSEMGR